MTTRALIAVADGVEDIETVTLIDVLRRAEVEVVVACIENRRMFTCARGTRVTADTMLVDVLAREKNVSKEVVFGALEMALA